MAEIFIVMEEILLTNLLVFNCDSKLTLFQNYSQLLSVKKVYKVN